MTRTVHMPVASLKANGTDQFPFPPVNVKNPLRCRKLLPEGAMTSILSKRPARLALSRSTATCSGNAPPGAAEDGPVRAICFMGSA